MERYAWSNPAGLERNFYGSASFYAIRSRNAGGGVLLVEDYGTAPLGFVPVITWEAETFDRGCGGTDHPRLLPRWEQLALLGTFGITAGDWERELVLDWTDLGFNVAAPSPRSALRSSRMATAPRRPR